MGEYHRTGWPSRWSNSSMRRPFRKLAADYLDGLVSHYV
jgi:hypothetical protein